MEARTYASSNMVEEMFKYLPITVKKLNIRSSIANIYFTKFLKFQDRKGILQ